MKLGDKYKQAADKYAWMDKVTRGGKRTSEYSAETVKCPVCGKQMDPKKPHKHAQNPTGDLSVEGAAMNLRNRARRYEY